MSLGENIAAVRARIDEAARRCGRDPAEITLVAATKVQTSQTIREAIAAGITVCGENRVQEMSAHLEDDAYAGARLHFIGHLQTNKVRQVVGRVDLLESVSSEKLLRAVDAQAGKLELVQDILLEVNIGGEESKSGITPQEVPELVKTCQGLEHVRLRGLMAIRDNLADNGTVIDCLSMGMSGDFEDAIAEGATLVRVGTALFGPRPPLHRGGTV